MSADNLNFCDALRAIKSGKRVQRAGWNGKGLCAFLQPGSVHGPYVGFALSEDKPADNGETIDGLSVSLFNTNGAEHSAMRYPQLCLSYPTGTFGAWAPSQTDMLASDWKIVEDVKEEHPPLAALTRGYALVDGRALNVLAALKEFAVSPLGPMSRDDVSFMIVHPDLPLIPEGQIIPTYRVSWDDRTFGLKFVECGL